MYRSESSRIVSILILGLLVASMCFGSVIDRRIDDDDDDAEQLVGGAVDIGSTDLELPYEEPNQVNLQITGVRFTNIGIPQGTPIISAYLQFQVDETKAGDQPVNLIIDGELSANAADFAAMADITGRTRTAAWVPWSVPNWTTTNQQGPAQRSPDLVAIIREIVNQPGWAAGNSIVLMLSDNPTNPSAGVRCAESHDGSTSGAPLLHIEYLFGPPTQPQPADGSTVSSNPVVLTWMAGDYREASHLYFGDNRANVEAGTGGTDRGLTYRTGYALGNLEAGTTYYWRIVEVNDANPNAPWTGGIWTFTMLSENAANPDPSDGSIDIRNDVTLSWDVGLNMANQDVHIGTDYNTVLNSTSPALNTTGTSWQPTILIETGQTYYWRIDTNDTFGELHKGEVWSFSTLPVIPITDPNLIGWWTFEDQRGPYALDQSGHDNLGVFVGDPQWVTGYEGTGLYLDGDDFMRMDDVADDVDSNTVTLSAWVSTTTADSDWYSCNEATGSGNVLLFAIVGGEAAVLDADNAYEGLPTTTVNDGEWHMLTYVCDGTTGYIYVDAALVGTHEAQLDFSDDNRWSVGQEWDSANPTEFLTGMVDDVRLYNKALTEAEIIQVMRVDPYRAWNPNPRQGATVEYDEMPPLSWSPGDNAIMHEVYFGTNRNAVVSADTSSAGVYKGQRSVANFDVGDVELGQTYFWRIDELRSGLNRTRGAVWSFTIGEYLVVDNFDSYVPWNEGGDHIFEAWRDGFGDCSAGNGNSTGSIVTEVPDSSGPVLEGQSMKYDFDNDGTVLNPCTMGQVVVPSLYSKIEAQTATLPSGIGSDWTTGGVKALSLNFYGQVGNAITESLWVQLKDAGGYGNKVFYGSFTGENPDDFNEASWHDWDIDLADFGVNLQNVISVVIGIGDEGSSTPGGFGTIYFDDIRLYMPRFIPARLTQRPTDYVFDGVIDYHDLIVMIEDWLMTDYSAAPLVAWYKLEGNADDSSGNGFHGTLENDPSFVLGAGNVGQAIDCNESEFVDTDFTAVDLGIAGRSARTITSWVNVRSFNSAGVYEMGSAGDGEEFVLRVRSSDGQWRAQYGGAVHQTITGLDTRGTWVHFAQVYTGGHSYVYVDGVLRSSMAVRLDTGTDRNFRIGRWNNDYFDGLIDDVRIYNKALSEAEIATVKSGGAIVGTYHPVESPMNLVDPEPAGQRAVNFLDLATFVDLWGEKQAWPEW